MKLGLLTKLDKGNASTSKKIDDDVMSANCDAIVFFPIYGQFEDNLQPLWTNCSWIPGGWSVKLIFSLVVTFYLQNLKTELKIS